MRQQCIYCGQAESTRKGDHIPPQKFFKTPRGFSLIQVPCCTECNNKISADDERMRNLLVSVDIADAHPTIELQLRGARNRSLIKERKKGGVTTRNLDHLLSSTRLRERFSPSGIYLGQYPAINFDQPVVHRFFDRMARALHHHRYDTGYLDCKIQSSNTIGKELKFFFETYKPTSMQEFGDDDFLYAEFTPDPEQLSIWLFRFYDVIEFWTALEPQQKERKQKQKSFCFPNLISPRAGLSTFLFALVESV